MITAKDPRVATQSKYVKELKTAMDEVYETLPKCHGSVLGKKDYINHHLSAHKVMAKIDEIIMKYGFEVDARECKHAHGIGNNNEWKIVDRELEHVAELHCINNMYGGVIVYVTLNGDKLDDSLELHPYMYPH